MNELKPKKVYGESNRRYYYKKRYNIIIDYVETRKPKKYINKPIESINKIIVHRKQLPSFIKSDNVIFEYQRNNMPKTIIKRPKKTIVQHVVLKDYKFIKYDPEPIKVRIIDNVNTQYGLLNKQYRLI